LGPAADERDGAPWRDALNPPRSRAESGAGVAGFFAFRGASPFLLSPLFFPPFFDAID
jgi:hypothetical protein